MEQIVIQLGLSSEERELLDAVRSMDVERARRILSNGQCGDNEEIFHEVLMGTDVDMLRTFLECGYDVDMSVDDRGNTPLHIACNYVKYEVVTLLLEYGANWNLINDEGELPIESLAHRYSVSIQFQPMWSDNYVSVNDCDLRDTVILILHQFFEYGLNLGSTLQLVMESRSVYSCRLLELLIMARGSVNGFLWHSGFLSFWSQCHDISAIEESKLMVLTEHVIIMESAGFEVPQAVSLPLLILNRVCEILDEAEFRDECTRELHCLQATKINGKLILFALMKNDVDQTYRQINEPAKKLFRSDEHFPLYRDTVAIAYYLGSRRRIAIDQAEGLYYGIFSDLPWFLRRQILENLKTTDLESLVSDSEICYFVTNDFKQYSFSAAFNN